MNVVKRAYLEIHLAVLLFGFTAILGDLIQLPVLLLVWWRGLLTLGSFLFLIRIRRVLRETPFPVLLRFAGIGVLMALQWLTFYGAIKVANASVTLVAMAITSFFTALTEPFLLRKRVKKYELFLGLLIVPGMILIANNAEWSTIKGLGLGLISAFFAALYTALNKKYIGQMNPMRITFVELTSAWIFFSAALPFAAFFADGSYKIWPSAIDWFYLIMLAFFCTTLAYLLAIRSLRHLSAFESNLTINLEPIYGITLAWFILNDGQELSGSFYQGAAIILATVFSYPFVRRYFEKHAEPSPFT